MVDYVEALKRPFSDIAKLVMYIILSIIPIVSFIASGYLLDVAETAMKKQKKLPDFKQYGRLFVEGIKSFVIGIIYMIPVFIVLALAFMVAGFNFATFDVLSMAAIAAMGTWMIVIAILAIVIGYFATGAILRYADKREFKEAFNLNAISKTVFKSDYLVGWLIGFVITAGLVFVIGLIPYIGSIIGSAIGGIFFMSVLGKVYQKA